MSGFQISIFNNISAILNFIQNKIYLIHFSKYKTTRYLTAKTEICLQKINKSDIILPPIYAATMTFYCLPL